MVYQLYLFCRLWKQNRCTEFSVDNFAWFKFFANGSKKRYNFDIWFLSNYEDIDVSTGTYGQFVCQRRLNIVKLAGQFQRSTTSYILEFETKVK